METSCWMENMMNFATIHGCVGNEMKWGMGEGILMNTLFGKLLNLVVVGDVGASLNFFCL